MYSSVNPRSFFKGAFLKKQKGMILVGVIALMVIVSLFLGVSSSIIFTSGGSQNNALLGTQALAIAQAGSEWYFETLRTDTDWTDEADQSQNFAQGKFDITVLSKSAGEVQFTSTGTITSDFTGADFLRFETWTVQKLPSAFKFALYQGNDPGSSLQLRANGSNPTSVTGNLWINGNAQINTPNSASGGRVYVPSNRNVTGTGAYTKKLMASPYLAMPAVDATVYTDSMGDLDALLDANTSTEAKVVDDDNFTVSGVMNFDTFTTRGDVTIDGDGVVVVKRGLDLHGQNSLGTGTSLTITPDEGGSITFITNRDLTIGSNNDNPAISITGPCTFYSRSLSSTARLIRVRGAQTAIADAQFLARRRIIVETGADISGASSLFISNPGSTTNNLIDIIGDSDVTSVSGNILSVSTRNPSILIRNGSAARTNVRVTGLVYARGSATTGHCRISDAVIQGSVVCNRYESNRVTNANITYQAPPASVPPGFEGFISKKDNSWDGY